jgi:glycosyltransferase involved in cell wall biosynthesis
MNVVHISYAKVNEPDARRWLEKINFFCGVLESMAKYCHVWSIHSIDYTGEIKKNNVHYLFIKRAPVDGLFRSVIDQRVVELKPDVVIVHGLVFPWQVLKLQRVLSSPTRLFIQNHAERPFRSHKAWLQKLVDRNVEGYFFASHDLAKPWIEKRQIADSKKIHEVMEVSSVFKPMSRADARQKLNINEDGGYLWVGRLNRNKNPLLVINAFMEFLDTNAHAKLYLIFQENDLLVDINKILSANPEKKKQIILVGNVAHADMIFWYNSMSYIISTSFYEGSGVAICEAMSCGCVPILTDIPSFRMMTANGRIGYLYASNDQYALVTALNTTTAVTPDTHLKVIDWFNEHLSFQAIAKKMMTAIKGNTP